MRNGLDFSFGEGLTTAEIQKGGMSFVGRYLSGGGKKDIGKTELDNYRNAFIHVIFYWETDGIMRSEADGSLAAHAANNELNALGAEGAAVFFAADAATQPDLTGYLKGAASVLGWARTGVYGGLETVQTAFNSSLVKYAVQTYAWSGSPAKWDDRALIRQYRNGVKFGPAIVDLEQAAFWGSSEILTMQDDFGQFPSPKTAPHSGLYDHTFSGSETVGEVAHERNQTEGEFVSFQIQHGSGVAGWLYDEKPHAGTNYKTINP